MLHAESIQPPGIAALHGDQAVQVARRDKPKGAGTRALLMGAAEGLAYGTWALKINASHGPASAIKAALAQCSVSFASTLFMVFILERLFAFGRTPTRGFWMAAIGTTMVSASLMATTHALAGTPRIVATVAPLVGLAAFVYTTYAWGLLRTARRGGMA